MKKLLLILLQWGVPVAIIAWLATDLVRNKSFAQMWSERKQWDLLALATLLCFTATIVTIVRWHFLVRAVDLPLRMRDTLRLGFLGYLYNFVLPGGVGGDFVKGGFLARATGAADRGSADRARRSDRWIVWIVPAGDRRDSVLGNVACRFR